MSLSGLVASVLDPWLPLDSYARNGDEHLISCDFGDGAPAVYLAHFEPHPRGFDWRSGNVGIKEAVINGYLPVPPARGYRMN